MNLLTFLHCMLVGFNSVLVYKGLKALCSKVFPIAVNLPFPVASLFSLGFLIPARRAAYSSHTFILVGFILVAILMGIFFEKHASLFSLEKLCALNRCISYTAIFSVAISCICFLPIVIEICYSASFLLIIASMGICYIRINPSNKMKGTL